MRPEALGLYRKTLIPMQSVILIVTLIIYLTTNGHWRAAGMFFIAMQLFAWLGASWGMRFARAVSASPEELPLKVRG